MEPERGFASRAWTIRAARADEAPSLSALALRSKASWGYPEAWVRAFSAELTLSQEQLRGAFVAEHAGEALGFYSLEPPEPRQASGPREASEAKRVELGHLFVEPSAQRRGLGRALMLDAIARARADGHRVMLIQGDPFAHAFYLRMGARQVGERESDSIRGRMLPLFELELAR